MKRQVEKVLYEPVIRQDGSCTACGSGHQCAYHSQEGLRRDRERSETLKGVAAGTRAAEIGRVCAARELESDEFSTREEKAQAIIDAGLRQSKRIEMLDEVPAQAGKVIDGLGPK